MKKKSATQSAFFNLRVLIALVVVSAGVFLALLGFGAFSKAIAQVPNQNIAGPLLTFEGQGNTCGCQPSDTDGDVGPNHYVEAINESIRIFDKTGNTLSGPTSYNSFFAGLIGTPCANANDGDPYVIYDQAAD